MNPAPSKLNRILAVGVGKAAGSASRMIGYGGGTALPGLVALKIDSSLVAELSSQLVQGSVLVTGTNGKTTTARLIAGIARRAGLSPLHNSSGSNLMRGIATALLRQASLAGSLPPSSTALGIFEVDEATLPEAVESIRPKVVVVNNLFRDQLDRYGELDTVAAAWEKTLNALPDTACAVLNADDPLVASLGEGIRAKVVYYGLDQGPWARTTMEHAADSVSCRSCGSPLEYTCIFLGHLGHYHCPRCGWSRPAPQVRGTDIELHSLERSSLQVQHSGGDISIGTHLPGLYNVYNITAAVAAADSLAVPDPAIEAGLKETTAAFGRAEPVWLSGCRLYLMLAKNPVGMNQVLNALLTEEGRLNLLFILNDLLADGRDISWIWDVDFESLRGRVGLIGAAGRRAEDMAVRLRYAGLLGGGPGREVRQALVERDISQALDVLLAATPEGDTIYIVPTYTAMLETRSLLARRKALVNYWASNEHSNA